MPWTLDVDGSVNTLKRRLLTGSVLILGLAAWTSRADPNLLPARPASREVSDVSAIEDLSDLRTDLTDILRGGGVRWRAARWSVLAYSLDTGDTLFALDPGEALAPASNLKLLTTAAALHHLGSEFRYQTFLLTEGLVKEGAIEGDLVLYGTGDPGISQRFQPTLTSVFEAFADSLWDSGVRRIEGDVVGDGSYFGGPTLGRGWSARTLNAWFAAPSGALLVAESVFRLRIDPSGPGERPRVHTLPEGTGVVVRNLATIGTGERLRVRREHPSQPILVEGSIRRGGREVWREMTVEDPALFAASVLHRVLDQRGIVVHGRARAVSDSRTSPLTGKRLWAPAVSGRRPPRVIVRHVSPPLERYLSVVNKRSHNLLADQVLRTVGRVTLGDGSFRGGARAVKRFLGNIPDVDTARVAIFDGSGLSSLNRASAADFVALTRYLAASDSWVSFWETLPEAGDPRGLRRMYRTSAQGNLRAKTGTISRVSALTGMVHSASGERIAFSIISNKVPSTSLAKRIEDRIGVRLASFERPQVAQETPSEP